MKHNPRKQNANRLPDNLEFRQVPGYPQYLVSVDGRFWTTAVEGEPAEMALRPRRTNKQPAPATTRLRVYLASGGKVHAIDAAALACEAWYGPRPTGAYVGFADGNAANLTRDNIGWAMPMSRVSDREFVIAWQSSYSAKEVAEKCGVDINSVYTRSKELIAKGVKLKKITGKEMFSVDDLNSLIDTE